MWLVSTVLQYEFSIFSSTIMKATVISILIFLISLYHVDAFLPASHRYPGRSPSSQLQFKSSKSGSSDTTPQPLTHAEIIWKLRPPPKTSAFRKLLLKLGTNLIRLEAAITGNKLPFVLCPKGGQAVLEAYYQAPYSKFPQKIGRFGITTIRGPPARMIDESVEQIYGIDLQGMHVGSAAIIYMFIEEQFRSRNVGTLALEVISTIHSIQGCDFTLLVADDDGSGKLVEWYEQQGFSRAPLLQDLLGSPGGKYGIAMIAPTKNEIDVACRVQWW